MAGGGNTAIWVGVAVIAAFALMSFDSSGSATISSDQLAQTASLESFSATAYPDGTSSAGTQLYSIGYGHQIGPDETYLLTATITQDQAQQLLLTDMQNVINFINGSGYTFTPGQFDALCDFGYNAGVGALTKVISTFGSSGVDAAAQEMLQYVYWHPVPGGAAVLNQNLVNRRNIEVATWNS